MENRSNDFYVVRCDRAGVFFGKIKQRTERTVIMTDVRKLWEWSGACAVEQLAMDGVKDPAGCRFTVWVPEMEIADPIQIIQCTDRAARSLSEVELWRTE